MRELDTYNRFRDSFRGKAGQDEGETPFKDRPVSADVALLRRVQRIVFGPNVTDLGAAKTRLESLIDALDDDDKEAEKKNEKPIE
jgi:hypothetical protein